jgi:hypothetical protein
MWKMCDACRERCRTITLERRRRQKETSRNGMFSIFKVDLRAGYTESQNGTKMSTGNGEDTDNVGEEESGHMSKRPREELGGAEQKGDYKENESTTHAISEEKDHTHQVC